MATKEISYKGQKIVVYSDNSATAFLFNEDGDTIQLCSSYLEEAKHRIDKWEKEHNGFYDADGNLIKS